MIDNPMQRLAEPLTRDRPSGNRRGPAAGGKRRLGAQPLTPSTTGMIDGGEGTNTPRQPYLCIRPFAHDEQARRAQESRGPVDQRGVVTSPISLTTQVRIPLDQHSSLRAEHLSSYNFCLISSLCKNIPRLILIELDPPVSFFHHQTGHRHERNSA